MKLRSLFTVALVFVSSLAFAMPPKPASCPSTSALKSQPFFMAQKDPQGHGYVALSLGDYQTSDQWGFVMGFFDAQNEMDALLQANKVLPSLEGNPEPMPIEDQNVWVCLYGAEQYQAAAVTPLGGGFTKVSKLFR